MSPRDGDSASLEVEVSTLRRHRRASGFAALPQGPSLRSGLCCPSPSSLNRPHAPHSPTRRNFPAMRVICAAFAVLAPHQPRPSTSGSELSHTIPSQPVALVCPRRVQRLLTPRLRRWDSPSSGSTSDSALPNAPLESASCGRHFRVGLSDGANRASNDADVSIAPPKIPYGGFSPVRLQGWRFRQGLPEIPGGQACSRHTRHETPVCLHPSCSLLAAIAAVRSRRPPALPKHHHASGCCRSTPGALAPVRVMLSRSIIT